MVALLTSCREHKLQEQANYSDKELDDLRSVEKQTTNSGTRCVAAPGNRHRNFKVNGVGPDPTRVEAYERQNESAYDHISCGIACIPQGRRTMTLRQEDEPSHSHADIASRLHLHHATANAIAANWNRFQGRKDRPFTRIGPTFRCLIEDFRLHGIASPGFNQPRLPLEARYRCD